MEKSLNQKWKEAKENAANLINDKNMINRINNYNDKFQGLNNVPELERDLYMNEILLNIYGDTARYRHAKVVELMSDPKFRKISDTTTFSLTQNDDMSEQAYYNGTDFCSSYFKIITEMDKENLYYDVSSKKINNPIEANDKENNYKFLLDCEIAHLSSILEKDEFEEFKPELENYVNQANKEKNVLENEKPIKQYFSLREVNDIAIQKANKKDNSILGKIQKFIKEKEKEKDKRDQQKFFNSLHKNNPINSENIYKREDLKSSLKKDVVIMPQPPKVEVSNTPNERQKNDFEDRDR